MTTGMWILAMLLVLSAGAGYLLFGIAKLMMQTPKRSHAANPVRAGGRTRMPRVAVSSSSVRSEELTSERVSDQDHECTRGHDRAAHIAAPTPYSA